MASKKKTVIMSLALMCMTATAVQAQTENKVLRRYTDSLLVYRNLVNDSIARILQQSYVGSDNDSIVQHNVTPSLYRLIGPSTYYDEVTHSILRLEHTATEEPIDTAIYGKLMKMYLEHPSAVQYYKRQYSNEELIGGDSNDSNAELRDAITEQLPDVDDVAGVSDDINIDITIKKPNFWKRSGSFALQFQQNYFSDNWYKGGNNNQTMLATILLQANYDDTKRVTWENRLDMRLGFVTTTSDSCHTFLTNNDKLNLQSKIGIKTTKNWYYTVSAEANTQFMPGYKSNNRLKFSDFMAPLDVYVSTGMDFKPSFKNGNTLSIAILPFSFKWRYIDTNNQNIHKVYNMVGKRHTEDYGSRLELNCKVKICKNFTWKCRSYYFTSYKYSEAELENTLSFSFSKYISSEVYTLWRFDDNRGPNFYDDNIGYFQFKEYMTLGLKYDF